MAAQQVLNPLAPRDALGAAPLAPPLPAVLCPVCLDDVPAASLLALACGHSLCLPCAEAALHHRLLRLHSAWGTPLPCLVESSAGCAGGLTRGEMQRVVAASASLQLRSLHAVYTHPGAVACPQAGCTGFGQGAPPDAGAAAGGADGAEPPHAAAPPPLPPPQRAAAPSATGQALVCNACAAPFCTLHGALHAAGAEACSAWVAAQSALPDNAASGALLAATSRPCPHCARPSTKADGCNALVCVQCGGTWCWGCGKGACECGWAGAGAGGGGAEAGGSALRRQLARAPLCTLLAGLPLFALHCALTLLLLLLSALCCCSAARRQPPRLLQGEQGAPPPRSAAARARRCLRAALHGAFSAAWHPVFALANAPNLLRYALFAARGGAPYFDHLRTALSAEPAWAFAFAWRTPGAGVAAAMWWHRLLGLEPTGAPLAAKSAALFNGSAYHASLGCWALCCVYATVLGLWAYSLLFYRGWRPPHPLLDCVSANGTLPNRNLTAVELLSQAQARNFSAYPCAIFADSFNATVFNASSALVTLLQL